MKKLLTTTCLFVVTTIALVSFIAPTVFGQEKKTLPPQPLGYFRFPAIAGEQIIFSAEGDLWRVPIQGGVAQRFTTHPAEESRPAVSPDGKTLAYSASYEGPTEVYTMPLDGGVPVCAGRSKVPTLWWSVGPRRG